MARAELTRRTNILLMLAKKIKRYSIVYMTEVDPSLIGEVDRLAHAILGAANLSAKLEIVQELGGLIVENYADTVQSPAAPLPAGPDTRCAKAGFVIFQEDGDSSIVAQSEVVNSTTDQLLLPGEVARLLRVNPKTVSRWAQAGKITAVRTLGGHRRFSRDAILKMAELTYEKT